MHSHYSTFNATKRETNYQSANRDCCWRTFKKIATYYTNVSGLTEYLIFSIFKRDMISLIQYGERHRYLAPIRRHTAAAPATKNVKSCFIHLLSVGFFSAYYVHWCFASVQNIFTSAASFRDIITGLINIGISNIIAPATRLLSSSTAQPSLSPSSSATWSSSWPLTRISASADFLMIVV